MAHHPPLHLPKVNQNTFHSLATTVVDGEAASWPGIPGTRPDLERADTLGAEPTVGGDRSERADELAARLIPQAHERLAAELAAEQGAHPRPGESERVAGLDVESNDELSPRMSRIAPGSISPRSVARRAPRRA